MDPVSLTASIIAVLQAAEALTSYLNNVRCATKEQQQLALEVANLQALLQRLRFRVQDTRSNDPWFEQVKQLGTSNGPLDQFKKILDDLSAKVRRAARAGRAKAALKWKFEKAEVLDLLNRMERLKSLISTALLNDQFALTQMIHSDIGALADQISLLGSDHSNVVRHRISSWLEVPDCSANYHAALKKRQPGTGRWLLESKSYKNWTTSSSSFLWLHGKPGCGKTVLMSAVTEDILTRQQTDPSLQVAYFYFDFQDNSKQRISTFLRSIMFHLFVDDSLADLEKLYLDCQNGQVKPRDDEVLLLLQKQINRSRSTSVLIDALDECCERDGLLEMLRSLWHSCQNKIHLIATSRPEREIREQLDNNISDSIDVQPLLIQDDIHKFVKNRLLNDVKLRKWPASVQHEILDVLMQKCDGMFRWVYCQLESIRNCMTIAKLRQALSSLPITLDETYERIFRQLDTDGYLDDATRVMQCLCFAKRPLSCEELIDILAIDLHEDGEFIPENRLRDVDDLFTICSNLVSFQTVTRTAKKDTETIEHIEPMPPCIRLAHFSVQEYLVSSRCFLHAQFSPPVVHGLLAEASLVYMLYVCELQDQSIDQIDLHPFIGYAAHYWWKHVNMVNDNLNHRLTSLIETLFDDQQLRVTKWCRYYQIETITSLKLIFDHGLMRAPIQIGVLESNLYLAAAIGCAHIVEILVSRGPIPDEKCCTAETSGRNCLYHCPLSVASSHGHRKVVTILLKAGVNPNTSDELYGTPLSEAAHHGRAEIVRMLLDHGADPNLQDDHRGSPLIAAAESGDINTVQMLLDAGAEVNLTTQSGEIALSVAVGPSIQREGYLLRDLFMRSVITTSFRPSPESLLTSMIVNLGHLFRLDAPGTQPRTELPLINRENTVRLLLDHGADPDPGQPLITAALRGFDGSVRDLLNAGAKADVFDSRERDLLLKRGRFEIIDMLVDAGLDRKSFKST